MAKKEVLIKREYYSRFLDRNTASFINGAAKNNIALLGPRRCGKTSIVKNHIRNVKEITPIYIDLGKISLNPENFSVEFIGNSLFYILSGDLRNYGDFLSIQGIIKFAGQFGGRAFEIIKQIENELLKIKPNQRLLVGNSFDFLGILAKESKRKFLVVLDNVENLLEMNNFLQIKDIFSVVDFDSKDVLYIATSSAAAEIGQLLKGFECHEIKNLDSNETFKLVESLVGKDLTQKISHEIFSLSRGHPFVAIAICKKYLEQKDAKKAFFTELLSKEGAIYGHCKESFDYYYNRARGQTLLKSILKVVASEQISLSEIARKIYRSAPVTKSILERLIKVGIIYKKDRRYLLRDEVLGIWINLLSMGFEFDGISDDKILDEVVKKHGQY